jgi:hypothetical protein
MDQPQISRSETCAANPKADDLKSLPGSLCIAIETVLGYMIGLSESIASIRNTSLGSASIAAAIHKPMRVWQLKELT